MTTLYRCCTTVHYTDVAQQCMHPVQRYTDAAQNCIYIAQHRIYVAQHCTDVAQQWMYVAQQRMSITHNAGRCSNVVTTVSQKPAPAKSFYKSTVT